jgi:hypothetical protein
VNEEERSKGLALVHFIFGLAIAGFGGSVLMESAIPAIACLIMAYGAMAQAGFTR